MKKVALLSIVLILLAVSVVPVMAGDGQPNGRGNGVSAGQCNNGGNRDQEKQQDRDQDRDQDQLRDRDRSSNPGSTRNGHQEHTRMRTPFYLQGSVVETGAGTLTVTLIHGNARVKQYLGSDLTIYVTEGTQIFQITQGNEISGTVGTDTSAASDVSDDGTPSNRIPITLDQLTTGQKVAIHGNLAETLFTARLITGYVQAP